MRKAVITDVPQLRLHMEDDLHQNSQQSSVFEQIPGLDNFIGSFREATGWEIGLQTSGSEPAGSLGLSIPNSISDAPVVELNIVDMASDLLPGESCVHREKCDRIVSSMNQILTDLFRTREAIQVLQAQLAIDVPTGSTEQDGSQLLKKLERTIGHGLEILEMNAGAVYLLDDETRELALRIQVGLQADSFLAPSRKLKDCLADLEALVGHAVMIDQAENLSRWHLPESFASGICVPVATHSAPLGTMWFFSDEQRSYSQKDSRIAEMIGGQIATELERESAIRSSSISKRIHRDIDRAKSWQTQQVPAIIPEIDGWQLSGSEFHGEGIGGSLFDYSLTNGGWLRASVGDVQGAVFESGLGASALRGAMRAHEVHVEDPGEFLFHVNNTMWNCPLGDQIGSLFHLRLDPESGIATWGNGGQTGAVIVGAGAEPFIATEGSPLGACEDENFDKRDRVILPNSVLFAFNDGFRQLFRTMFKSSEDYQILDQMQAAGATSSQRIYTWVSEMINNFDSYRTLPDISFIAIERLADEGLCV